MIPFLYEDRWIGASRNRPAVTFSPSGEKDGMRGRSDDAAVSFWELV